MRDIQDKVDASGDLLSANAFNANLINELQDFVTSAGFTLDPEAGPDTDISMFRKSVAIYSTGAMYFNESGAADAYVLTRSGNIAPMPYYFDGMTVIFKPTNDNIGASTINVDSLGVKDLVASDGSALVGGEIVTDLYVMARFRSSTDDFEIVNSSAPGDAATLEGHPASYFAVDSLAAKLAATQTFTGTNTFGAAETLFGANTTGDTVLSFRDFNSSTYRSIRWANSAEDWYVEDNSGANQKLYHSGNDSALAHLAGNETFTGQKLFSAEPILFNNVSLRAYNTSATSRPLILLDSSDIVQVGSTAQATNLRSDGTLTYNGASLASGTIDTTATQTITVVDGLITSIV